MKKTSFSHVAINQTCKKPWNRNFFRCKKNTEVLQSFVGDMWRSNGVEMSRHHMSPIQIFFQSPTSHPQTVEKWNPYAINKIIHNIEIIWCTKVMSKFLTYLRKIPRIHHELEIHHPSSVCSKRHLTSCTFTSLTSLKPSVLLNKILNHLMTEFLPNNLER